MAELLIPYYINKKGKKVEVNITEHARRKFASRWHRLFPESPNEPDIDNQITKLFMKATRIEPKNSFYLERLKKHGKDSLYFKDRNFTYIVQDATLITIEISSKWDRDLNKTWKIKDYKAV